MLKIINNAAEQNMKKSGQAGFHLIEIIIIVVVIGVLGFIGWYVYQSQTSTKKNNTQPTSAPKQTLPTNSQTSQTPAAPVDPYAGWKTYTSPTEKLSFKYPADWISVKPDVPSTDPNADSFQIKSPSGLLNVSWLAKVSGLGGSCDSTVMPGVNGACAYWTVLDKQKLSGADLYYAAGIVTYDGATYRPWCALQSPDGILESKSVGGDLVFHGKNNNIVMNGPFRVGLLCGRPTNGYGPALVTKAEATAALSTKEYQQAKLIILSASY